MFITPAARARLVGDLPGDRERQRATERASPAAARDPDLRRAATRRRESWRPASSTSPCSRSGSPPRGCFRSCAAVSPETRIVIDSIDVHFLRAARQGLLVDGHLDEHFGARLASELNAYRGADAVLTVSSKEARLLGDFLGPERIHDIPLAQTGATVADPLRGAERDPVHRQLPPPAERRGGRAPVPRRRPAARPALREEHPVYVIGSRLDARVAAHGRRTAERQDGRLGPVRRALPRARAGLCRPAAARRRRQGEGSGVACRPGRRSSRPPSEPRASSCATASMS